MQTSFTASYLFFLFLPRERLGQALASLGAEFLLFGKLDTYRIHSSIMQVDGGKEGRLLFSHVETSLSYSVYL